MQTGKLTVHSFELCNCRIIDLILLPFTNKQAKKEHLPYTVLQPPSYSIGRHVFLSGILSVLSGGTVNLLTLVTMNIIFILIPGFDIYIDFFHLWMRP